MTSDLMKAADELKNLVQEQFEDGCDICQGDCSSANPPMTSCPMQRRHDALTTYRKARESAGEVKVKPLVWYETDAGYKFQDYIGVYEVYLNTEGSWTFDSGESVSSHASKEAAMGEGITEHRRRIRSALVQEEEG